MCDSNEKDGELEYFGPDIAKIEDTPQCQMVISSPIGHQGAGQLKKASESDRLWEKLTWLLNQHLEEALLKRLVLAGTIC